MGLKDKMLAKSAQITAERKGFTPLELNEGNVQAIFNRCLAKEGTLEENIAKSILFSRTLGYKPSDEVMIRFNKQKLLADEKNIRYLYGQLRDVHQKSDKISTDSISYTYLDKKWTNNKARLLELLYFGGTRAVNLISPFSAKDSSAGIVDLKPTLSPKDPAFPAWWEAHKAEWE